MTANAVLYLATFILNNETELMEVLTAAAVPPPTEVPPPADPDPAVNVLMPTDGRVSLKTVNEFKNELTKLLNRHSIDTLANTPDYVLSQFVTLELLNLSRLVTTRDTWFNFKPFGGMSEIRETVNADKDKCWWLYRGPGSTHHYTLYDAQPTFVDPHGITSDIEWLENHRLGTLTDAYLLRVGIETFVFGLQAINPLRLS